MDDTILRVDDIQKFYGNKGNLTKAVDHISFSVRKGESVSYTHLTLPTIA